VRSQLRFFEQLDQMEKQRKEEQEREILLKAAKVNDAVTMREATSSTGEGASRGRGSATSAPGSSSVYFLF